MKTPDDPRLICGFHSELTAQEVARRMSPAVGRIIRVERNGERNRFQLASNSTLFAPEKEALAAIAKGIAFFVRLGQKPEELMGETMATAFANRQAAQPKFRMIKKPVQK